MSDTAVGEMRPLKTHCISQTSTSSVTPQSHSILAKKLGQYSVVPTPKIIQP